VFSWVGKLISKFLEVGGVSAGFIALGIVVFFGMMGFLVKEIYAYKNKRAAAVAEERREGRSFLERLVERTEKGEIENFKAISGLTTSLTMFQAQCSAEIGRAEDRHSLVMASLKEFDEKAEQRARDILRNGSQH
jgi:hypothetical protein